jgi:hypothetical protein
MVDTNSEVYENAVVAIQTPDDWISVQAAADDLGKTVDSIHYYIKTDRLVARRLGERPRSPWIVYRPSLAELKTALEGETRGRPRKTD